MKQKLLALGAVVALCPMLASAGETYIGGSLGMAKYDLNIDEEHLRRNYFTVDMKDMGYKLFLGHRFFDSLALELSYVDFGQVQITRNSYKDTINSQSVAASVVGIAPLTPAFEVLGKVGLHQLYMAWHKSTGYADGTTDFSSTEILYGVGVNYKISSFALRAEYERYTTTRKNNDLISVGASWSF